MFSGALMSLQHAGEIVNKDFSTMTELSVLMITALVLCMIYVDVKTDEKMGTLIFFVLLFLFTLLLPSTIVGYIGAFVYYDNVVALVLAIGTLGFYAHPVLYTNELREQLKKQLFPQSKTTKIQ